MQSDNKWGVAISDIYVAGRFFHTSFSRFLTLQRGVNL